MSTPPDLVKAMANIIPDAAFTVIRPADHIPPVEQPDALADLITDFVERILAQRGDRHAQGMATRRRVLGDAHVDRAEALKSGVRCALPGPDHRGCWGHLWSRPNWTLRERSMVTIALLAALGHDEEVAMHVRATLKHRCPARRPARGAAACGDLCRRARANRAIKIVKDTLARMTDEPKD